MAGRIGLAWRKKNVVTEKYRVVLRSDIEHLEDLDIEVDSFSEAVDIREQARSAAVEAGAEVYDIANGIAVVDTETGEMMTLGIMKVK